MSVWEILKYLLDDFARQRWGDLVALFLIVYGVHVAMHGGTEVIQDLGKSLVAAGLISLRLKPTNGGNGNGTQVEAVVAPNTTTVSVGK